MAEKTVSKTYDLEERTAKFGEKVIEFCLGININAITKPIISQLIRSATSVGANYLEANDTCSKKDVRNKIHICKKEASETKHWLRMLLKIAPEKETKIKELWSEAHQLTLIFSKALGTLKSNELKLK